MTKKLFSLIFIFSALCGPAFCDDVISDFTRKKVEDFVDYRVSLKSEDETFAYETIQKIYKDAMAALPDHAKDLEQETCILDSLYFTECYEHALNSTGNQKELRDEIKRIMKANFACIEARKKDEVCDWMYQLAGDVTSYYMTRSVAATFFYGMKVKGFYEKAIEANNKRSSAYVCLGNWCFYAPALFGGGKGKSKKHFEKALECAELPGEKYLAYIAYSQINFENKKKAVAEEYLEKGVLLGLGRKELDLISKCNEKGYSYFQYLRNRSGIDEEMSEEEKDEDDK